MLKRIFIIGLLLSVFVFYAAAQENDQMVVVSGDITTIYTLGNAISSGDDHQRIDMDPATAGAFFNNPVTGTRKNGYYTAANLYTLFTPVSWIEGYFKVYAVHRPGSFYLPLQMENLSRQDFTLTLDAMYGKASVFDAFGLDLPVELTLKAGKFKSQASQYGNISKYKTEQVLYMMNTKTDFTYELGFALKEPNISFTASTNYLLSESVQRYYDEDGAVKHGNIVLNEFAPQFLIAIRIIDFSNLNAELIYGQNVSNIYSGHAAGLSLRYTADVSGDLKIPIGLSGVFHEKNIDLLGQAAIADPLAWAGANITTMDFRESIGAALGAGLRYKADAIGIEANLAGSFYNINHYYRDPIAVLKLSLDAMFTYDNKFFIGAGAIAGSLLDTEWKTTEGVTDDNYAHTFALAENLGFEVYGGINLGNSSRFVIGFNQNKGLSINNMLESRHEGQMKFKQIAEGTTWANDQLAEAGGLYFKFFYKF